MGCFSFKKSPVRTEPNHPDIYGNAACRRLSLDPYQSAASRPSGPHMAQPPSSSHGRAANANSISTSGPSGAASSLQQQRHAASAPVLRGASPIPENNYIEVNPLRRMSLPMQGQVARPPNQLRRGSMPNAV